MIHYKYTSTNDQPLRLPGSTWFFEPSSQIESRYFDSWLLLYDSGVSWRERQGRSCDQFLVWPRGYSVSASSRSSTQSTLSSNSIFWKCSVVFFQYNISQVFGRKQVILITASESEFVYPASDDPMLLNTSQVDVEKPDLERFPLFAKATQIKVFLRPGDMLYIPPKCWHFVKSLDPSFSVRFWFDWLQN